MEQLARMTPRLISWLEKTESEWQAVADFNGSYTYGCGTTINHNKANYYDSGFANPLGLGGMALLRKRRHG
jgi:hypothetical protein